jgi:predicted nuclease of predicted toxin-antitoxin system
MTRRIALLVDQQLPAALARYLTSQGLQASHVQDIGLESADDKVIWQHAKEHELTIITKDEDFQALAIRQASIPPQVVWVRLGNCRTQVLLEAFSTLLPAMREMLLQGEAVVEIR